MCYDVSRFMTLVVRSGACLHIIVFFFVMEKHYYKLYYWFVDTSKMYRAYAIIQLIALW